MITDTPVEYFYGETLRWSFGFDNPNKAAVLFACSVPLLWYFWQMSWRLQNKWLKIPALLIAACALLAAWYCLIMTYSRGGLVAAAAALLYGIGHDAWRRIKQKPPQPMRVEIGFSIPLVAALAAITLWSGLAARSTEALGKDASVGNRIELWSSALQMAAENFHGFGTGKSGEQYMQWYQPLDRQEGYRTMVNSYLTFLVEQGWGRSGAVLLGWMLFWVWTRPRGEESISVTLRASILAFLVAGVFSTTMEDWRLWMIPGVCGALLTLLAIYQKRSIEKAHLWVTGSCLFATCAALFAVGYLQSGKDALKREFGSNGSSYSVTSLAPSAPKGRSIGCLIDESVMGDQYAKLLREMSISANVKIMLGNQVKEADRILISGNSIHSPSSYSHKPLLLLAPEKILETELSTLTNRSETLKILLPEIDEDGRVDFWDAVSEGALAANFQKTALVGVGNRVDWAWGQVIDLVKAN